VIQNGALDAASYEDARIKLESNMTNQAIMGLNTRAQKSYMDNKAMGNTFELNRDLEAAASRNPFLEGKKEFNPNQLSDLMLGNSDEEIEAMQRIAKKLVQPQLVATSKDVHLVGESSLKMQIELDQITEKTASNSGPSSFGIICLLAISIFIGIWLVKR